MSESEEKKISRRHYLQLAAGTIAGLAVGGALGYVATQPSQAVTNTVTVTETAAPTTLTAAPTTVTAAAETLPVGFIGPLSGDWAYEGIAVRNAIEVGLKQLRDAGGIRSGPNKGAMINMIYEDDQFDPAKGLLALEKLITIDKVGAIIGVISSMQSLPYSPVAIKDHVIMIGCNPTNPALSQPQYHPGFYRLTQPDQYWGPTLGKIFVKFTFKDNGGKFASAFADNETGRALHAIWTPIVEKLGGSVLCDIPVAYPTSDVRSEIVKLKASNPGNNPYYLDLYSNLAILWAKQAYELGYGTDKAVPLISELDTTAAVENKQYLEGAMVGPIAGADKSNPVAQKFMADYQAMYGKPEPENFLGWMGYDNFLSLWYAIEKGGYTWDGLNSSLEGMTFQGARESYTIRNGELDNQAYSIYKVTSGVMNQTMFIKPEDLASI